MANPYISRDSNGAPILVDTVDPSIIRWVSGTLSAGQVKALNATPIQVIAAPGVGYFTEVVSVHWMLDFGGNAYDAAAAGDTLGLVYSGKTESLVDEVPGDTFGASGVDAWALAQAKGPYVPYAATAVMARIAVGEWYAAAGDSPVKYHILYRTRPLLS